MKISERVSELLSGHNFVTDGQTDNRQTDARGETVHVPSPLSVGGGGGET